MLKLVYSSLFIVYMVVGVIFIVLYECEFNAEFVYAFRRLSIIIFILTQVILMSYSRLIKPKYSITQYIAYSFIFYTMILGASGGYVSAYNALVGKRQLIEVSGVIKNKFSTSGKYNSYYIEILDLKLNKNIELHVAKRQYDDLLIGDEYKTFLIRGSLGIFYRERSVSFKVAPQS